MPPSAPQEAASRARRRDWLAAAAVLALALALWFPGLLAGERLGQSHVLWGMHPWLAERPAGLDVVPRSGELDAAVVFHPLLTEARRQLLDGHLPLWNPYSFAGMPLLGDWQSGWLFPLNWVALALGVEAGWGWIAVLKLLLGGLGAVALARRWGVGLAGATVAGLAFMLSAPNLVWLQWPVSTVFCLLPWLLLATDRVARRPDRRAVAGLGLVVGTSLLAGHPESALISSSAVAVYLAVVLWRREGSAPGRAAAAWLGGHLLGVAVAAAIVLPFLQAWTSSISRSDHGALAQGDLPWWSAIVLAVPNLFGDGKPEYFGPPLFYPTVAGYAGAAAGLLALAGAWRLRRRPEVVATGAMVVVALCAQFGVPPVDWLVRGLPPWNQGNSSRTFHVVALAIALGAGAGVQALLRRPMPAVRAGALAAGAGAVVGAWALGLLVAGELPAPRAVETRALARCALALLAGAACLWLIGRVRPLAAAALVLAVVALDAAYLRGYNVVLPAREAYPAATGALRALDAAAGPAAPARVVSVWPPDSPYAMPPNTGALLRLESVQGYDFPPSARWSDFSLEVLGQAGATRELSWNVPPRTTPAALAGLRMMGVRYYLAPPGGAAPAAGLRRFYAGADATVWEDPDALPRAFLLGRARRAETAAGSLGAFARGEVDPRREVVVEAGAPGAATGGPARAVRAAARRVAPDRLRIDVPRGQGGWLVVSEGYWPFFEARVDGRPAPIVPANHTAMAVPVAAGDRVVEIALDRTVTYAGFAISAVALLVVAGLAGVPRRRWTA